MATSARVNYDAIAQHYDRRYADDRFAALGAVLRSALDGAGDVLEVGCGTGHWLAQLQSWGHRVTGVEPSRAMREKAAARGLRATVLAGRAEALPIADASQDRVVCVNAHHHFDDFRGFATEAFRVLRSGGRILTIALDPHNGADRWSLYDYFEGSRERDLERYPPTALLRQQLAAVGFRACESFVAQHLCMQLDAEEALARGLLDRDQTSQLTLLDEDTYAAGIAALRADADRARARDEGLTLTTDLRLYATTGSKP